MSREEARRQAVMHHVGVMEAEYILDGCGGSIYNLQMKKSL
jgi:hypothetical protein